MNIPEFQGRLIKWNKTFGFIRWRGQDVFVHLSNCVGGFASQIEINCIVSFQLTQAYREDKKYQAHKVRFIRKAEPLDLAMEILAEPPKPEPVKRPAPETSVTESGTVVYTRTPKGGE